MSFILGAGAYYVFGSSLGLRTRSQELADAKRHAITRHYASLAAPVSAPQFDVALAQPVSHSMANVIANGTKNVTGNAANASSSISAVPVEAGLIGPVNIGGPIAASSNDNSGVSDNSNSYASNDIASSGIPISYTPPVKTSYSASVTAPQPLTDLLPFWPSVIPSPLEKDRGTISFQYGAGPGPGSTTVQWNMFAEFKFSLTLWDYFVGAASMGELSSFQRIAQSVASSNKNGPSNYSIAYVVNTSTTTATTTTLMGLEAGITLDHIGIPITAMGGVMFAGPGSQLYGRGSLMMHFEPLDKMVVSLGIEGLFYNHDLTGAIATQEKYSSPYPTSVSPAAVTSEDCGLVGPSIQIGWHF
jgi:hypothetical protein